MLSEKRKAMTQLFDDYPRMIEVEWFNRFTRKTERKSVKVYSANDEALVRAWHDDTNHWSKRAEEALGNVQKRQTGNGVGRV